MKKLLLFAAIAASSASMNAETFSDIFKLTYGEETVENGQTVTVPYYYDPFVMANPDYAGLFPPSYESKATIIATNVYDEAMDIAFVLTRSNPEITEQLPAVGTAIGHFQLCFNLSNGSGNCIPITNNVVKSPSDLSSIAPEEFISMDIDQMKFTDLTETTYKLDLCVTEGGDVLEGTDCTVYIKFTHTSDITAAVDGIEADDAAESYYNLQGMQVAHPEKGGIYVVRKGGKVSKRVF